MGPGPMGPACHAPVRTLPPGGLLPMALLWGKPTACCATPLTPRTPLTPGCSSSSSNGRRKSATRAHRLKLVYSIFTLPPLFDTHSLVGMTRATRMCVGLFCKGT